MHSVVLGTRRSTFRRWRSHVHLLFSDQEVLADLGRDYKPSFATLEGLAMVTGTALQVTCSYFGPAD